MDIRKCSPNQLGRRSAAKIESGLGTERALRQRLREAWVQNVQDQAILEALTQNVQDQAILKAYAQNVQDQALLEALAQNVQDQALFKKSHKK